MNGKVKCIQDEIPFEIPESWVWCRLNCICEIKGGKRIPKGLSFTKNATEHIYIRITDMKNETIYDNDLVYISNEVYNKISNYIISKDDLYVTIAGTIGRCGEVPDKFNNMNLTENAVKLTRIQIDKSYLKNIINSEFIFNNLNFKAHQVAQPKLSIITLSNVLVPIAPYKEQIEISVKIQNIRKSILKLLNILSVVSNMKQQLKSKVLDSIFSDNSSYKSYYGNRISTNLEEYIDKNDIGDGDWVLSENMDEKGNIKLIQLKHIGSGKYIDKPYCKINNSFFTQNKCSEIKKDYLLINRLISDKMNVCIMPDIQSKCITSVDVCWIKPNNKYLIKYLMYYLMSPCIQKEVLNLCSGSTRKRISKKNLIKIPMLIHNLNVQKEIVKEIDKILSLIDSM